MKRYSVRNPGHTSSPQSIAVDRIREAIDRETADMSRDEYYDVLEDIADDIRSRCESDFPERPQIIR